MNAAMKIYKKLLYICLFFVICAIFISLNEVKNNEQIVVDEAVASNGSKKVLPSGDLIGIYVKTKGVMVTKVGEVAGKDKNVYSPCKDIIRQGDYIVAVDNVEIEDKKMLTDMINNSMGRAMTFEIVRDEQKMKYTFTPVESESGEYKLGIWVKDDISGIGTLTYVDETNFAALGHSVNDNDTGKFFSISDGAIYRARLTNIIKAKENVPGRLEGLIDYSSKNVIGRISSNANYGICGKVSDNYNEEGELKVPWMEVAGANRAHTGAAYILTSISGNKEFYEVMITNIDKNNSNQGKTMEIKVTDEKLLELTGGIVQGFSGTPVIQDGKLLGAITHVFVNDSTRGYACFVEDMMKKTN